MGKTSFVSSFQGLIQREEGRDQDALKSFQQTIEFDSKNANNYKEIGKTLYVRFDVIKQRSGRTVRPHEKSKPFSSGSNHAALTRLFNLPSFCLFVQV